MDVQLTVTDEMKIKASHSSIGNEGDHNFTRFNIERPSFLSGYTCRADFLSPRAGVGQKGTKSWLPVYDDTFLLPNSLTRGGKLSLVLTYGSPNGEITARTNVADFIVGQTISAVNAADTEFQDGLAQLAAKVDSLFGSEQGLKGEPGASAYELAVREGFTGTLEEWLESLVGPPGDDGGGTELYDKLSTAGKGILKLTGVSGTSYIEFPESIIDFKDTSNTWGFEIRVKMDQMTSDARRIISWNSAAGGALKGFTLLLLPSAGENRIRFTWNGETSFTGEVGTAQIPLGKWFSVWLTYHGLDSNNNGVISYGFGESLHDYLFFSGTAQAAIRTGLEGMIANKAKFRIGVGLTSTGAYQGSATAEIQYIKLYNSNTLTNPVAEFVFDNAGINKPVIDTTGRFIGVSVGATEQIAETKLEVSKQSIGLGNIVNVKQLSAAYDSNSDGIIDASSSLEFGLVNYSVDPAGIPLLSFSSDDGRIQEYTVMKPIFEEYGIPLNLAIPTIAINRQSTSMNYLWQWQLEELYALGWSLVSHSHSHLDLSTLSLKELDFELGMSSGALKKLGWDHDIIIIPYGGTSKLVKQAARNYYKFGININRSGGLPASNYVGAIENMAIWRQRCVGEGGVTVQDCKDIIDAAITENNGNWVVFYNHSYNLNAAQITDYRAVIEYALAKQEAGQLRIVNLREGCRLRGNVLEVGETEDAAYTRIDRNGKMRCKGAAML